MTDPVANYMNTAIDRADKISNAITDNTDNPKVNMNELVLKNSKMLSAMYEIIIDLMDRVKLLEEKR